MARKTRSKNKKQKTNKTYIRCNKYSFCYISILYRVIILRAYIDGIFERKKNTLKQSDTKKDWYSKGYK